MKKKFAVVILAASIMARWVVPAFAAQGQITEVNPSGLSVANQANDGNAENNNQNDAAGNGAPVFDLLTKDAGQSTSSN